MSLVGTQGGAYTYLSNRSAAIGRTNVQRDFSTVYHQSWGNSLQPAAAAVAVPTAVANGLVAAHAGPNTQTRNMTLAGTLVTGGVGMLIPLLGPWTGGRTVQVNVTHATSIVACNGVITGIDIYGRVIVENWTITATGTTKTYATLKAFKYITSITETAAADASANTIQAGDGVTLGLDVKCFAGQAYTTGIVNFAVKELVNSAIVTTGTIVPFDPTNSGLSAAFTADPRGTYLPAAAPNGAIKYDLWYISDDPEFSDTLRQ